jgi:hypothetical protein
MVLTLAVINTSLRLARSIKACAGTVADEIVNRAS